MFFPDNELTLNKKIIIKISILNGLTYPSKIIGVCQLCTKKISLTSSLPQTLVKGKLPVVSEDESTIANLGLVISVQNVESDIDLNTKFEQKHIVNQDSTQQVIPGVIPFLTSTSLFYNEPETNNSSDIIDYKNKRKSLSKKKLVNDFQNSHHKNSIISFTSSESKDNVVNTQYSSDFELSSDNMSLDLNEYTSNNSENELLKTQQRIDEILNKSFHNSAFPSTPKLSFLEKPSIRRLSRHEDRKYAASSCLRNEIVDKPRGWLRSTPLFKFKPNSKLVPKITRTTLLRQVKFNPEIKRILNYEVEQQLKAKLKQIDDVFEAEIERYNKNKRSKPIVDKKSNYSRFGSPNLSFANSQTQDFAQQTDTYLNKCDQYTEVGNSFEIDVKSESSLIEAEIEEQPHYSRSSSQSIPERTIYNLSSSSESKSGNRLKKSVNNSFSPRILDFGVTYTIDKKSENMYNLSDLSSTKLSNKNQILNDDTSSDIYLDKKHSVFEPKESGKRLNVTYTIESKANSFDNTKDLLNSDINDATKNNDIFKSVETPKDSIQSDEESEIVDDLSDILENRAISSPPKNELDEDDIQEEIVDEPENKLVGKIKKPSNYRQLSKTSTIYPESTDDPYTSSTMKLHKLQTLGTTIEDQDSSISDVSARIAAMLAPKILEKREHVNTESESSYVPSNFDDFTVSTISDL